MFQIRNWNKFLFRNSPHWFNSSRSGLSLLVGGNIEWINYSAFDIHKVFIFGFQSFSPSNEAPMEGFVLALYRIDPVIQVLASPGYLSQGT